MQTIILIACASKKVDHRARARDLYKSDLFEKSLAYAESLHPDAIYILSAKHGLLDPETEIEPYDVTLNRMSAAERKKWARGVLARLGQVSDLRHDRYVILAGTRYRQDLTPHLAHTEIPMEGLRIGEQLQFLGRAT